jgi:SMC interacting uncharacterized protein involved in chromosome segregation
MGLDGLGWQMEDLRSQLEKADLEKQALTEELEKSVQEKQALLEELHEVRLALLESLARTISLEGELLSLRVNKLEGKNKLRDKRGRR